MKVSNEELLAMMLSGQTQSVISRTLNMSKQAVCERVNKPEFQSMLHDYRKKVLDSAYADLTANIRKAVDTLCGLMDSKNEFVRYSASTKIIQTAMDFAIAQDLMKDVEELKQAHQAEQQRY